MATGTVTWTPTNGSNYEVWYGKLSVVGTTSLPPTAGWTQAPGSPFASTLGTATISGLDDNTQYRIVARADCGANDSPWIDNIKDKLVCPTFSLVANPVSPSDTGATITATVNIFNYVEFETIGTSITLSVKKTSDSSIASTKVFDAPYSGATFDWTFTNLLVTTGYTVYLTVHTDTDVTCSNHAITTQTPVVVPPPVCTAPTFTITNIGTSTATLTITSTLTSGDTYDISLNGGASYAYTGQTTVQTSLVGLTANTSYQIVVRRNCVGGGQGFSTSQTFMTNALIITGTFAMNSNRDSAHSGPQGTLYLTFTFPQPTPFPITLYFGWIRRGCYNQTITNCQCRYSNGFDIFVPIQTCAPFPNGDTYYPHTSSPFVVNIPSGVTTYNSGTNIHNLASDPNPWINLSIYTDLYVKVVTPGGYGANFTIVNGVNISGVTLHNI